MTKDEIACLIFGMRRSLESNFNNGAGIAVLATMQIALLTMIMGSVIRRMIIIIVQAT